MAAVSLPPPAAGGRWRGGGSERSAQARPFPACSAPAHGGGGAGTGESRIRPRPRPCGEAAPGPAGCGEAGQGGCATLSGSSEGSEPVYKIVGASGPASPPLFPERRRLQPTLVFCGGDSPCGLLPRPFPSVTAASLHSSVHPSMRCSLKGSTAGEGSGHESEEDWLRGAQPREKEAQG